MATTLVGQTISSTFKQLTHVDGGVGASESALLDGDGTESALQIGTDNIKIATHDGSTKGLKLNTTLITASGTELNQLDGILVGGTDADDIVDVATAQSLNNKTIDGGTY